MFPRLLTNNWNINFMPSANEPVINILRSLASIANAAADQISLNVNEIDALTSTNAALKFEFDKVNAVNRNLNVKLTQVTADRDELISKVNDINAQIENLEDPSPAPNPKSDGEQVSVKDVMAESKPVIHAKKSAEKVKPKD